ncbi:alpha/beta hydrolase [Chelatococcus asaccharovorans]|uniref:alpha/beta hydrolase n=1 Tax=Chelatococcus asaccharovorans TaxID=28210 RepID=UPI00224C79D0|nr:alpha/beta hydrolase family protein [Chelatococcus asaccharovorans]CAH1665814.1 salicylate esterase [Chelatococcus asaccharovorans]CAH1681771.1 salicylate esterase [Chelatococcus asaccharovorans]
MTRRDALKTIAAAGGMALAGASSAAAAGAPGGRTFVLVHGAWHGGWCWQRVADRLTQAGHRVFTPTQTGLGERRHLMSRAITLDTFTLDVANLIEMEDLGDVVLVGHSFGGCALSGVADRMPERIRRLVYLDAMIVEPGRKPFDALPAEGVAARIKAAEESSGGLSLPAPAAAAFGVTDAADAAWLERHLTPQPLSTYLSPLNVNGPIGNGLAATYIGCVAPAYAALNSSRDWARNRKGFDYEELAACHDAMVSAPDALTARLLDIAAH